MHKIQQLEQDPILIFEGTDPPTDFMRTIQEQLEALPVVDSSAFNRFLKEKKRHYRVAGGLLAGEAARLLHDDLLEDLEFAREDGELDFQCSRIESAAYFNILTGYRMLGSATGWLFRSHYVARIKQSSFNLLLPKE